MNCPKCGCKIPINSNKCGVCGTQIDTSLNNIQAANKQEDINAGNTQNIQNTQPYPVNPSMGNNSYSVNSNQGGIQHQDLAAMAEDMYILTIIVLDTDIPVIMDM